VITSQKIRVWAGLALGLAIIVAFALPSYRQGEASLAGKPARDFSLDLSGKPVHLSDFRGKVVVLNFWATWCPPCKEETPSLNHLQKYMESRNGLVLGIAADEDAAVYQQFLRDEGVIFPTYRDPATKNQRSPIALSYGTSIIPETYVIDRHGKIARKLIGFQQWDSPAMLAYIDSVLAKS
jgi:peroxiredoxin